MFTRSRQSQPPQTGYTNATQRQGPPQGSPTFPPQNIIQQQQQFPSPTQLPPNQLQQQQIQLPTQLSPNQQQQFQNPTQTPLNQQGNLMMQNAQQFVKAQQPPLPPPQPMTPQQLQQHLNAQLPTQLPTVVPQAGRLKPILKQTPATPVNLPAAVPVVNVPLPPAPPLLIPEPKLDEPITESMDVEADGQQPLRRWKRKASGLKVNRKLKRLRLNQKLRKTLQPKNAIMVLNEMKTGVQFTFPEPQGSMASSLFLVHAEIDGKTYVGQGLSKPLARQNAAENALKSLLLEKMTAASMKARLDAESEAQNQILENRDVLKDDESVEGSNSLDMSIDETDEIPWSSLASFALYKLFLEWQNQGTVVPVPRPGIIVGKAKREHKPHVQKELPPNALGIHPVMLLNQMRPGLVYVEANRVGNPPNTIFTLAVEIDGVEYHGTAKNKRDAKKAAAKAALQALYNLTYPEDSKTDASEDISIG